jgi:RNA polymerase sigma-70 factor, ECF subfamily
MSLPDERDCDRAEEEDSALPRGASERFTALLVRHHPALMGYILSLVPSWPDAEDLLQQTSVVMWRKFGEFRAGTDFVGWGCHVARYHTLNHLRKRARDRHIFSPELLEILAQEGALDAEQLDAERAALRLCLEKLDPRSRNLVGRCYQPEATVKTVAEYLGRTPNSVYKGLNRIREALLRCIRRTLAQEGA